MHDHLYPKWYNSLWYIIIWCIHNWGILHYMQNYNNVWNIKFPSIDYSSTIHIVGQIWDIIFPLSMRSSTWICLPSMTISLTHPTYSTPPVCKKWNNCVLKRVYFKQYNFVQNDKYSIRIIPEVHSIFLALDDHRWTDHALYQLKRHLVLLFQVGRKYRQPIALQHSLPKQKKIWVWRNNHKY